MGEGGPVANNDPTRMTKINDNTNNRTLEGLMSLRNQDIEIPGGSKPNLNKM